MRNIQFGLLCASLICGAALFLAAPAPARAASSPVFLPGTSSITMTHYDDTSALSPSSTVVNLPGGSIPAASPGSFQLINTFSNGSSNTVADSGAFQSTSATTMTLGLKAGTGVTQTNPSNLYSGFSELNISADLFWQLGAAGFPPAGHFPGVTFSFNVGGTVGAGDEVDFVMNMNYYDIVNKIPTFVGSANIDAGFTATGAFTHLFTSSVLLNGGVTLPANSQLELVGNIAFTAFDPLAPADIHLIDDGNLSAIDIPPQTGGVPLPASWQMSLAGLGLTALLVFMKRRAIA